MLFRSEGWWKRWGSAVTHGVLDVVGLIPVVGEIADGASALIYVAEGDYVNAAISAAAMIPGAGMAATGAKYGKKVIGAVVESAAKKAEREAAERAAKELAKKKAEKEAAEAAAEKANKGKKGGKDDGTGSLCKALAAAVYAKVPEVAKRFLDLMEDKLGLFKLTRNPDGTKGAPHPSLPKGSGTWHGHLQQIEQKQRSLRDSIEEYDVAKCKQPKIPKPVRDLAWLPIPRAPGGSAGYPFTQIPK